QVNIVPVNMKYHDEYCKELKQKFIEEEIRVNYDTEEISMNKKIRNSNIMKNPYTIIIGDKERDNNLISYRKYGSEKTISMNIEEFINQLKKESRERK